MFAILPFTVDEIIYSFPCFLSIEKIILKIFRIIGFLTQTSKNC